MIKLIGEYIYETTKNQLQSFIHKPDIVNFSKIREELYGNDIDAQLGQSFREDEMKL